MFKLQCEIPNTPENSNENFEKIWRKQLHYIDWTRFRLLSKYFESGNYLDLGCFNSPMPFEIKNFFKDEARVYAVDFADKVIEHLKKLFPEVHYMCCDLRNLPYKDDFFDYVVAGEVIEHMEDYEEFLKEAMRVLKPRGTFALSTPSSESKTNPTVSKEHFWSFEKEDIMSLLAKYGDVSALVDYSSSVPTIIAYCKKYDRT